MGSGIDDVINCPKDIRIAIRDLANGDGQEQRLLSKAYARARSRASFSRSLDLSPINIVNRAFSRQGRHHGTLRRQHHISQEVVKLSLRQIAFGVPPDSIREEHSRFCHLMYLGYQQRFLNRHPGEEPEQFLDRARKMIFNWTRLIVDVKSILYITPPVRELTENTPEHVRERLEDVWSDQYDRTLLEVDRYTRLVGTVSVRPFYDPASPGKIRLWAFLSHQLRVIPDDLNPWKPKAVMERMDPFSHDGRVVIWTDKSVLVTTGSEVLSYTNHTMGRIPHTFFRDRLSFQSFFVEGEGRSICETNGTINDKISDLNEIIQFQGFSSMEVINPVEDDPVIGPRRTVVFRPSNNNIPFGIRFANPKAPIADLCSDIDNNVENLLKTSGVPNAAVGLQMKGRGMSGISIKAAYRPIINDSKQRAKIFAPSEIDLTDSVLRVLSEHDDSFDYTPDMPGKFKIRYVEPEFPEDLRSKLEQEQFDVQQGITTPPDIMMDRDPAAFSSRSQAVEKWRENIALITSGGRPLPNVTGSNQTPPDVAGQVEDFTAEGFSMNSLIGAMKDEETQDE